MLFRTALKALLSGINCDSLLVSYSFIEIKERTWHAGLCGRVAIACSRLSDNILQNFVAITGSSFTFAATIVLIIGWGIAGIFVASNAIWQIAMQVKTCAPQSCLMMLPCK